MSSAGPSVTAAKRPRSPSPSPDAAPAKKPRSSSKTTKAANGVKKESANASDKLTSTKSWTAEEHRKLYELLSPKVRNIKWDEVAANFPGRGAKSCSNKWARLQAKILDAVSKFGE